MHDQQSNNTISLDDFEKVAMRVGTIVTVEDFPLARKPAYILTVDFGDQIGLKKSSAQITHHYDKKSLIGKQVLGVINFPVKQIGPIMSQVLITGFADDNGEVILAVPDKLVKNGAKLF